MIILHTSDWHLGQKLHDNERFEEHSRFLDWLLQIIDERKIDVLLVSGDIFDTANPPQQAKSMYYDFLVRLRYSHCKHVVITGGNHDSPGELNAPKAILRFLNIHVIGCATDEIADELIQIKNDSGDVQAIIAAVPFLRDRDIRKAAAGDDYDEVEKKVKDGIVNHYRQLAELIPADVEVPVLAMGHLFAAGVSTSDSEKEIHVGNLGQIPADLFPVTFKYIALGHIHKPQVVGKMDHVRYCGSPIPLSFSEYKDEKQVVLLHWEGAALHLIEEIKVPVTRRLLRFEGSLEEVSAGMKNFEPIENELTPWVEVKIKLSKPDPNVQEQVKAIVADKMEVLLVRAENMNGSKSLNELITAEESLDELSPLDVFTKKCEIMGIKPDAQPELFSAFKELLSVYYEKES